MSSAESCIYVVDDDVSAREAIIGVARSVGLRAVGFESALQFLAYPRNDTSSCLVLDVEMPELSGLDLQQRLNATNEAMPTIFVTGYGDVPMSVTAIRAGAVDFLMKPFDAQALLDAISRALNDSQSKRQHTANLSSPPGPSAQGVDGIVGDGPALQRVLQQLRTVALTDTTVLIQGETGTGKERVARALHDLSNRRNGRFVKVNCAAIPAGLFESELMGHEKGAFTGALAQRIGRFELAHNGTIFLDEIGELPLDLQPKLLRVLQEREFERLGSTRTVRANARVVAATNRDLKSMARERTFREDLYYRLSVFPIEVPPLRERTGDIPALAEHFVREFCQRMGKPRGLLAPAALERLLQHDWPGNIRELQNVLERAVILSQGGKIDVPELDSRAAATRSSTAGSSTELAPPVRSDGLAEMSKAHILRVLKETNWVVAGPNGAAARLKMKRSTLNFRMKKLGISRPEDPQGD